MTINIFELTIYHRKHNLNFEGVDVAKRLSVVALVLFVIGGLTLPVYAAGSSSAGDYVVVLKDSVSNPGAVASQHARTHGAQVGFVYASALKGYSATIPHHRVQSLRSDSRVDYIEVDAPVHTLHHRNGHDGGPGGGDSGGEDPPPPEGCPGSQTLPWGIDRIDADLSSTKAGDCNDAISTNVYIIDTGVDQGHSDLKVVNHVSFIRGPNKDCHGHGTHVAGTVAAIDNTSDVVGAAPGAPITGVKVLDCAGFGSVSTVVAGVDWVTQDVTQNNSFPAIANMSLGGGASDTIDKAVLNSVKAGIFYSVAAGNSGDDACKYSPARIGGENAGVMTVGATDSSDNDPSWSNFGECVDIWAPGVSIVSTANGGGTATASGTSMASPHVGGTAALLLNGLLEGSRGSSPSEVESSLKENAEEPTPNATKANDGASISLVNAQPY